MDEFKDQVSDTTHFNVGYYDGPQHCKLCLVTSDDLKSMYSKHPNGVMVDQMQLRPISGNELM